MQRRIKLLLWVIADLLISYISFAQTVYHSEGTRFGFRNNEFALIGRTNAQNYIYRTDNNEHFIDIMDDTLRKLAIVTLDYLPQKVTHLKITTLPKGILALYQYSEKNNTYVVAALMQADGRLAAPPKVLDSTAGAGIKNDIFYDYTFSENKEYVVIHHHAKIQKQAYLQTSLYTTSDLQKQGGKEILLSGARHLYPQQYILSNKGVLYFSSFVFSNEDAHKSDYADIVVIDFFADYLSVQQIPLQGLWIDQMLLKTDQNSEAVSYAAFYANNRRSSVTGLLYGKIYKDDNVAPTFQKNPFTDELLTKINLKKNKKSLDDFIIKDIIMKQDGGILLVAEYFAVITRNTGVNSGFYVPSYGLASGGQTIKEYTYGDLLVVNLDASGAIIWENIIRKKQFSQDDFGMFSSYAFANTGKYLVFVYNDFTVNKKALTIAAIDNKGLMNFKQVKHNATAYDWIPKYAIQTSALSLLFPCFSNNTLMFSALFL